MGCDVVISESTIWAYAEISIPFLITDLEEMSNTLLGR